MAARSVARPGVSIRTLVVASLLVLTVVASVFLLSRVFDLVLLFLIAVVVAEGLRPLVERFQRMRIPQVLAIVIVYVILLAVVALTIAVLVQPVVVQATNLAHQLPTYQASTVSFINDVESKLNISSTQFQGQVQNVLSAASQILVAIGGYIVNIVINLVLVLVLSFLWLTTSDRLKGFFVDLFPLQTQPLVSDVIREMGFRMGGYLRAVAINMLAVGLATGIACALLGLPSPLLLGIFAGVTAAVPLVGPFLGVVPAVLLGFTVSATFPIVVLIVLLIIQLADGNTIVPLVMNRVLSLPALAVVIALLVGGALAGMVGALLAVPVAAALQVMVVRVAVPLIHYNQGRADSAFAAAFTPVSPALRGTGPSGGGRRLKPR